MYQNLSEEEEEEEEEEKSQIMVENNIRTFLSGKNKVRLSIERLLIF